MSTLSLIMPKKRKKSQRCATSHLPESQFESGSCWRVLLKLIVKRQVQYYYRIFFWASWAAVMLFIFFCSFLVNLGYLT